MQIRKTKLSQPNSWGVMGEYKRNLLLLFIPFKRQFLAVLKKQRVFVFIIISTSMMKYKLTLKTCDLKGG
jgi:hypothetical protein